MSKFDSIYLRYDPSIHRYIIMDRQTNEVLADACGHGFRSKKSAFAYWSMATKEYTEEDRIALEWLLKHPDYIEGFEKISRYNCQEKGVEDHPLLSVALVGAALNRLPDVHLKAQNVVNAFYMYEQSKEDIFDR